MTKYVMGVLWVCYGYPMGEEGDLKVKGWEMEGGRLCCTPRRGCT